MERYARFIVRHNVGVLTFIAIVTALAVAQLPNLRFEIQRRAQLPQGHPYVRTHNDIADMFGGETTIVVGVMPRRGDIFTPTVLDKVQRITRNLERQPGVVPGSVLSIAAERVKSVRATDDGIDVHPFYVEIPNSPDAIRIIREEVRADSIFSKTLVGGDSRAAAIVADFDDRLTDSEIHRTVSQIVDPERDSEVAIAIGGAPLVRAYIAEYTKQMGYLFLIAVAIIGLVHFEAFRTLQAMLLPLVTALLSVIWTLGLLGASGEPLDTWTALTPIVILAVAAGHAVQILKRYYEEYDRGVPNREAVVRSLVTMGPVMITAGTIAAAGFASLMTFGVGTVRVFALTLALGILSSLVIEMSFIPACRALMRPRQARKRVLKGRSRLLERFLEGLARVVTRQPKRVLAITVILVGIAVFGVLRVRVNNSFHEWFPADSRLRTDDIQLNQRLAGTSTLYVLLQGQGEGDLLSPKVLEAVGDLEDWLKRQPNVGAAISVYDYVQRMHTVMTGATVLPQDEALIEQYLFLYSMSGPDELGSFLDGAHRNAVLRAYAKTDEAEYGTDLLLRLQQFARVRFEGLPVTVRFGGGALGVQSALNEVVVREKLVNILQVTFIIFLLSALAFRSIAGGILVITPLMISVTLIFGIMGFTNTWLSVGTATVSAMAVSIGADFAIYLIARIREEIGAGFAIDQAVVRGLRTAGGGVCFVASAVVLGYLVLSLSGFRLWVHLGVLTAMMIAVSALAALTIVPSLITIVRPRFLSVQSLLRGDEDAAKPGAATVTYALRPPNP
jgi:hydrophobe/amphiphile efflux-3 (HAE3) family protein